MTKTNALPRPVGATALSLLALLLGAIVFPAAGLAAPLPEGSDAVLAISPSPVVVPTATVGSQSPTAEFVLTNEGVEAASVEKVALEGEDAGEFSFGGSNCGFLQPGEHCSVWIGLKPSSLGLKKSTLYARFSGGRPEQSFEVSGTSAPAHFSFEPGSYDFGLQRIHGESVSATFQLRNDGAAGAQVNWLNLSGANTNGFLLDNYNDCSGRWLEPNETCSVRVYFGPSETGFRAVQLQAGSSGETFTAGLSGEGGQAIVEAFPNPADFGAVTVGATGPTQTIVVHNSGSVPTGFFIGIVAGGDSGSFQLVDENCTGVELMPSASCTAHVRFRPQSTGAKLARLALFGDSDGGTMVALSGEGVAPAATLMPSSYDFGSLAPGTKSPSQSFAVRNEGSTSLDLGAATIVGADLDQFSLASDDCSGATLEPDGECVIRVRFRPDDNGVKTARLRVSGDAASFSAALTGTGGPAASGSAAGAPPAGAASSATTTGATPDSRPGRHRGRHRRFARGDAVVSSSKRPAPRRGALRASSVPR
jgi:hypothetical protein